MYGECTLNLGEQNEKQVEDLFEIENREEKFNEVIVPSSTDIIKKETNGLNNISSKAHNRLNKIIKNFSFLSAPRCSPFELEKNTNRIYENLKLNTMSSLPQDFKNVSLSTSYNITTHVLDTCRGLPAPNISVCLQRKSGNEWMTLSEKYTDNDGRAKGLLGSHKLVKNEYRLMFYTSEYFKKYNQETFYPKVCIEFIVENVERNFHIPLLLSNFGYTTYRGS